MADPLPSCPSCLQPVGWDAAECPECGLTLAAVDAELSPEEVLAHAVNDRAHVLRAGEKQSLERALAEFQRKFPQVLALAWIGAFESPAALRKFGFWLLNRGAVADSDPLRPNENGLVLLVDMTSGTAALTLGYAMERWLAPEAQQAALGRGRKHFTEGRVGAALEAVLAGVTHSLLQRSTALPVLAPADPLEGVPKLRAPEGGEVPHAQTPKAEEDAE